MGYNGSAVVSVVEGHGADPVFAEDEEYDDGGASSELLLEGSPPAGKPTTCQQATTVVRSVEAMTRPRGDEETRSWMYNDNDAADDLALQMDVPSEDDSDDDAPGGTKKVIQAKSTLLSKPVNHGLDVQRIVMGLVADVDMPEDLCTRPSESEDDLALRMDIPAETELDSEDEDPLTHRRRPELHL
eukprot:gnl/MRDRNA2_/MRDRNA2_91408_c0_seq1.p1 gnl/MRDRNA2_/MRDRNA2_91408_c0~~gnl/MRDRNA2_/MRDRNA2_91408_c0_seq1.p1  ORF type:complete len:186 (-),score=47.50 gnl/MRDRNA2_/MRDRNA2_91408_c0_seq1:27-584(-)